MISYKGRSDSVAEIGRDLGVRYVLEGSVRRTADRLRINVQLIDAPTGGLLWADGFDRGVGGMLEVESEVTRQIVAKLELELSPSERSRLDRPPTDNLQAYDSFLRAERAARSGRQDQLRDALSLYAKATELDPSFAKAFAAHARTAADVWAKDYDDALPAPVARQQAFEMASRAVRLDPDAPFLMPSSRCCRLAIVNTRRPSFRPGVP